MRESIGGTWLVGLVITFMLIFVAYLTVMINYSTAFKTKNEVVHIIEKYEGITSGSENSSIWIINQYLRNSGYNATGKCGDGSGSWYGAKSLKENAKLERADNSTDYFYCVKYSSVSEDVGYYDIKLFLHFDLPVLGQIGRFQVKGQTIKIKYIKTDGCEGRNGCVA